MNTKNKNNRSPEPSHILTLQAMPLPQKEHIKVDSVTNQKCVIDCNKIT